jgi:hypothetical protein
MGLALTVVTMDHVTTAVPAMAFVANLAWSDHGELVGG